MANLGVVSDVLARGHSQMTALCELAVNMARKTSEKLCFVA